MATKTLEQLVSDIGSLTVLELAELTKSLEAKFGVSAMAMAASATPAAAPAEAAVKKEEEKTEYQVELLDGGAEPIKTIKALRSVKKDLSLVDASKAVKEAPTVLVKSASKDEAKALKDALEAAGAKVKLS
jgi:large subunit ribosomal protein L7/L12